MKLIDANALMRGFEAVLGAAPCELSGYEIEEVLNDQPTIDAIPVEWLRKKQDEAYKAVYYCKGADRQAEIMAAVRMVLAMWEGREDGMRSNN